MRNIYRFTIMLSLSLAILAITAIASIAAEVPRITVDELSGVLGSSEIVVLDVRASRDWDKSTKKISGSVRAGTAQLAVDLDKKKTIVLYCA